MWELGQWDYPCKTSEAGIKKELKSRYPGYHGNIKFHRDIVCKNRDEASQKLDAMCDVFDDHAIFYKEGRKKNWLVGWSVNDD